MDREEKLQAHWGQNLTKYAVKILKRNIKDGRKFAAQVVLEGEKMATVINFIHSTEFIDRKVDLKEKTCSCNVFQDRGIPCDHACAFMAAINIEPKSLISNIYLQSRYSDFLRIPSIQQQISELHARFEVLAPKFDRRIGRPRRRRIRNRGESSNEGRRQITCSSC